MSESQSGTGHHLGIYQFVLLVFTILILAASVTDTVLVLPQQLSSLVHMTDTFACVVFFADFCFRFHRADSKLRFMKWGWIDLIACIPNLEILRWGRLVRVLRIIRVLRGIRSVQLVVASLFRNRLHGTGVSLVFSAFLLVAFSSASILVCERQPDSNIKTAEDAIWWSVSTITTVGYGDRYPVTTEGRVIGFILMIAGVSMFGCLSGLAASFFMGSSEKKQPELDEVLARLNELHAKVDALGQERKS